MSPIPSGSKARGVSLFRLLGILLCIVAFPLASVRIPPDTGSNSFAGLSTNSVALQQPSTARQQPLTLRGTHCASMSLIADVFILKSAGDERSTVPLWLYLAAIGGWTNPLVAAYLAFSSSERFCRLRLILSVAIALCLSATAIVFATSPIVPLPGYFLWLSGILVIIFPLAKFTRARAPEASDTPARLDP